MTILFNPYRNLRSIYNYYEETKVQNTNLPKVQGRDLHFYLSTLNPDSNTP